MISLNLPRRYIDKVFDALILMSHVTNMKLIKSFFVSVSFVVI